ncbi:MAG TPA: hypothetical protein VE465_02200 [Streptosporangiaceae bacterium]|jgi:hypothetical protein|nr:hypothetical protein [Streptosporangiaceae bacterium]
MSTTQNHTAAQAQALVDAITSQAERDEDNYRRGWNDAARLFFDAGVDVGRAQVLNEQAGTAAPITPTHAELEALRYPHHTPEQLAELRRAARERYGMSRPEPAPKPEEPRDPWATLPPGAAA